MFYNNHEAQIGVVRPRITTFWPCKGQWERRRGTQQSWEDNMNEWTGQERADSQRAANKRETWREIVLKAGSSSLTILSHKIMRQGVIYCEPTFICSIWRRHGRAIFVQLCLQREMFSNNHLQKHSIM